MWQKASTLKLHGHNFHQSYMFSKIPSVAAAPGFKSQCQSSLVAPFPTPPTISYTCQDSHIVPALLGCHSKSPQAWPHGVEPIISKLSHRQRKQGELLHHGLKSLPSPWLKAQPQLFNISMKPVKGYRYVKQPF